MGAQLADGEVCIFVVDGHRASAICRCCAVAGQACCGGLCGHCADCLLQCFGQLFVGWSIMLTTAAVHRRSQDSKTCKMILDTSCIRPVKQHIITEQNHVISGVRFMMSGKSGCSLRRKWRKGGGPGFATSTAGSTGWREHSPRSAIVGIGSTCMPKCVHN